MNEDNTARVSVIIPAYNAEHFLQRAVASAVIQGSIIREIIIVENNSTDNTEGEINRLCSVYGKLIIPARCTVQGPAAARNHGIGLARGEWLQFLDADDYLYEGKILRQLSLLSHDTRWVSGVSDVVKDGEITETFALEEDAWRGLLFCRGLGDTNANLFHRQTIIELKGYDDLVVGEDYHLYFKLLRAGKPFVQDAKPGSAYVQHDENRGEGRGMPERWKWRKWFVSEIETHLLSEASGFSEQPIPLLNSAKLAAIRMMLTVDAKAGKAAFTELFGSEIPWSVIDHDELPVYAGLYRVFGFLAVERARVRLARIRRNMLTFLPNKNLNKR